MENKMEKYSKFKMKKDYFMFSRNDSIKIIKESVNKNKQTNCANPTTARHYADFNSQDNG